MPRHDHSATTQPAKTSPGLKLQPRDLVLLTDLFETRMIAIRHAAKLYFHGREPAAKQRLRKLHQAGLLRKQDLRVIGPRGIRTLYLFTKESLDFLIAHGVQPNRAFLNWDSKLRKRFVGLSPSTLEHELDLLDIRAALEPTINAQAYLRMITFGLWPRQCEFHVQRHGRRVKQQPDGYFCYAEHSPNREPVHHHFYLELDRGTEKLDTLATKVAGYRQHYRNGGFCRWLGCPRDRPQRHPFRVLIIAPSAQRRDNITARLAAAGVRRQVWLATLTELLAQPLGPIWSFPRPDKEELARKWSLLEDPAVWRRFPPRPKVIK